MTKSTPLVNESAGVTPPRKSELENYMPIDADLKPCPFCGAKAVLTNVRQSGHSFAIGCVNESCWRPRTDYYDTQDGVVSLWNARSGGVTPPPNLLDAMQGLADTWRNRHDEPTRCIRELEGLIAVARAAQPASGGVIPRVLEFCQQVREEAARLRRSYKNQTTATSIHEAFERLSAELVRSSLPSVPAAETPMKADPNEPIDAELLWRGAAERPTKE